MTSPLASPSSDSDEESAIREGGRDRPWYGDGEGVLVSSSLSAPGTRNEAYRREEKRKTDITCQLIINWSTQ